MEASLKITPEGDSERITIIGPINEEAEVHFANLANRLGKKLIFNFRQVTFINSLGVRAWINFMRELGGRSLVFEECIPEIINQINMIPNFRANADIKSIYATFFCDSCSKSQEEFFVAGKNMPQPPSFSLAPVKCKSCGHDGIEFEEVEDSFFAFLNASK